MQDYLKDLPKFKKIVIGQIESVRVSKKLTKAQMADILGTSPWAYSKMLSGEREISIDVLLTFCRRFNYDFKMLAADAYFDNAPMATKKLALFLSKLSNQTLESISSTILNSNENSVTKERSSEIFGTLTKNSQSERNSSIYFFERDIPESHDE